MIGRGGRRSVRGGWGVGERKKKGGLEEKEE